MAAAKSTRGSSQEAPCSSAGNARAAQSVAVGGLGHLLSAGISPRHASSMIRAVAPAV